LMAKSPGSKYYDIFIGYPDKKTQKGVAEIYDRLDGDAKTEVMLYLKFNDIKPEDLGIKKKRNKLFGIL